jgi:thiol-disulfide isomerase/thioredoxin
MPQWNRMFGYALLAVVCGSLIAPLAWSADKEAGKVSLQIANWDQTQKLVAKNKGKIVVLDAWSTSCEPCKREFPNLVKLHKKFPKDVACMSLSCDYVGIKNKPPEFYRERVLKFLESQEATFTNIMANTPADDLFAEMDLAAIPAVYVYGRDGKLVKRFDNDSIANEDDAFTYEDVNKLVGELLKK